LTRDSEEVPADAGTCPEFSGTSDKIRMATRNASTSPWSCCSSASFCLNTSTMFFMTGLPPFRRKVLENGETRSCFWQSPDNLTGNLNSGALVGQEHCACGRELEAASGELHSRLDIARLQAEDGSPYTVGKRRLRGTAKRRAGGRHSNPAAWNGFTMAP
jgi:hypothetical protein